MRLWFAVEEIIQIYVFNSMTISNLVGCVLVRAAVKIECKKRTSDGQTKGRCKQ